MIRGHSRKKQVNRCIGGGGKRERSFQQVITDGNVTAQHWLYKPACDLKQLILSYLIKYSDFVMILGVKRRGR